MIVTALLFAASTVIPIHADEPATAVHAYIAESRTALSAGQYERAVELAARAVDVDPVFADAWKQYGRARMLWRPDQETLDAFDRAWLLNPEWRSEVPLWKAGTMLQLDQINVFRAYLTEMPEEGFAFIPRVDVIHWLEILLERREDPTARLLSLKRKDIETDPAIASLLQILADSLSTDPARVPDTVAAWVSDLPDSIRLGGLIYHHAGRRAFQLNELIMARQWMEKAMRVDPGRYQALGDLGWAYLRAGYVNEAMATWRVGVTGDAPHKAAWLVWIAEAENMAGRYEPALQTTSEALSINPAYAPACTMKLYLLLKSGRLDEAVAFERSIRDADRDGSIRRSARIRWLHDEQVRFRTPDMLQSLVEKDGNDDASRRLAFDVMLEMAGKSPFQEKEFLVDAALQMMPDDPRGLNERGWIKWEQGRVVEALASWERTLVLSGSATNDWWPDIIGTLTEHNRQEDAIRLISKIKPEVSALQAGKIFIARGRLGAAIPMLKTALDQDPSSESARLLSGFAYAMDGRNDEAGDCLHATMSENLSGKSDNHIDLLAEVVALCPGEATAAGVTAPVRAYVKKHPVKTAEVTSWLMTNAATHLAFSEDDMAYTLFNRVVEREPASEAWLKIVLLAENLVDQAELDRVMDRAIDAPTPPAVNLRLRSVNARREGKIASAITFALESLDRMQDQPDLRVDLFDLLMAAGRYQDAVEQCMWLQRKYTRGASDLLPAVAHMLVRISRSDDALSAWTAARELMPEAMATVLHAADELERQCRIDDAAEMMKAVLAKKKGSTHHYARLGELEWNLGRSESAVEWVERGLSIAPGPSLFRLRAELAEIQYDWMTAGSNALWYVDMDPGYPQMHRLVSRSMMVQRQYRDAIQWNRKLLERNPYFSPAHLDIRDAYAESMDHQGALDAARQYADLNKGDPEAMRGVAISAAEDQQFHEAIKNLKPIVEMDVHQAVPVIIYRQVSPCHAELKNSVRQVGGQLQDLSDAGFKFITPSELLENLPGRSPRIMIVFVDPDPAAMPALQDLLEKYDARAVLAVNVPVFRRQLRASSGPDLWNKVATGKRWVLASSGPDILRRARISEQGWMGNPLTHRIMRTTGERETLEQYEQRLDDLLRPITGELPTDLPILVYPQGDYGQLSLDCSKEEMEILHRVVKKHFALAIAQGDSGFIVPGYDPWRIPARTVPPPAVLESATIDESNDLIQYLQPRHPILRAELDLARFLSQHGQYARAEKWFQNASARGAEPASLLLGWGINAYRMGDIPSALTLLRQARETGSFEQDEVLDALDQAELTAEPRSTFDFQYGADSDDRELREWSAGYVGRLHDTVRLGGMIEDQTFERDGLGDERALRLGVDALWYPASGRQLTAAFWWMNMESGDVDDVPGGSLKMHSFARWLNGSWALSYAHDQIKTVEAVRNDVQSDTFSLQADSVVADRFDVRMNATGSRLTDDNESWSLDGRVLYRMWTFPYLGFGYRGRVSDHDFVSPDYYSPDDLEHHGAVVSLRGDYDEFRYSLTGEAGTAREGGAGWTGVWSMDTRVDLRITDSALVYCQYTHHETPSYDTDSIRLGMDVRF